MEKLLEDSLTAPEPVGRALESELIQERTVTFSQLLDAYYPESQFPQPNQLIFTIKHAFRMLMPYDLYQGYNIGIDSLLPALKNSIPTRPGKVPFSLDEYGPVNLSNDEDQFIWQTIADQGLKLNITFSNDSDLHNTRSGIISRLNSYGYEDYFEQLEPQDFGLSQEQTQVYRMKLDCDRIIVSTLEGESAEAVKAPLIIIQRWQNLFGDNYFTFKLAVDTSSDSAMVQTVAKFRSLFEMKFSNQGDLSPIHGASSLSWERSGLSWTYKPASKPFEPYTSIPSETIQIFNEPLSAELTKLAQFEDPRDYLNALLIAGRIAYLTTIADTTIDEQTAATLRNIFTELYTSPINQSGLTPFEQVVYELLLQGEDFSEEIHAFVDTISRAYLNNSDILLENLRQLGLDKILPYFKKTTREVANLRDCYRLFNPISHTLNRENQPTKEELKIFAKQMRFCMTLARDNWKAKEKADACIILKDGVWKGAGYDGTRQQRNPFALSVIEALIKTAKNIKDPSLTGCDVILLREPTEEDALALSQREGIKRIIFSVRRPSGKGEGIKLLKRLVRSRNPQLQIIEGLLKLEVNAFLKEWELDESQHASPKDNYDHRGTEIYTDATRQMTQDGSLEQDIVSEWVSNSFDDQYWLDVGCNGGHNSAWLNEKGAIVYGVDASAQAINRAQTQYPHLQDRFLLANISENLPFRSASFDHVLFKYVLNELKDVSFPHVLQELSRILKPGGTLSLFVHHPVSQMFLPTANSGDVTLDYFAPRVVQVPVYPGMSIKEPSHTIQTYIQTLLRNEFIIRDLREFRESGGIHQHLRIPETLAIHAQKI